MDDFLIFAETLLRLPSERQLLSLYFRYSAPSPKVHKDYREHGTLSESLFRIGCVFENIGVTNSCRISELPFLARTFLSFFSLHLQDLVRLLLARIRDSCQRDWRLESRSSTPNRRRKRVSGHLLRTWLGSVF